MSERGSELMQYQIQFGLPVFDLALLASAMRWGMLVLIIVLLLWLMSLVFPSLDESTKPVPADVKQD